MMNISHTYADIVKTVYKFDKYDIQVALVEKYKLKLSGVVSFEISEDEGATIVVNSETVKAQP